VVAAIDCSGSSSEQVSACELAEKEGPMINQFSTVKTGVSHISVKITIKCIMKVSLIMVALLMFGYENVSPPFTILP